MTMKASIMKALTIFSILALAGPLVLSAQQDSDAEEFYIYATYFYCDIAQQEKVDELVSKNTAPIYDAAEEDGTIHGWGWLAHHTGGKWRRIQYHTSDSVEGLLTAQETIAKRVEEAGHSNDGFGEICNAHEDYIWKREAGSTQQGEQGPAQLSVYQVCNFAGEQRAREIVTTVFAPVYDKAVADGKLTSWGYNSHVMGGKYRVLQTMSAKDNASLLKARAEILETLYGDGDKAPSAAAEEYARICTSHTDYLWEIQH